MRHAWWLIPLGAALAVVWWAKLAGLAVLVTVVCGLAALLYAVCARRGMSPLRPEQEREKYRFERDIPPR